MRNPQWWLFEKRQRAAQNDLKDPWVVLLFSLKNFSLPPPTVSGTLSVRWGKTGSDVDVWHAVRTCNGGEVSFAVVVLWCELLLVETWMTTALLVGLLVGWSEDSARPVAMIAGWAVSLAGKFFPMKSTIASSASRATELDSGLSLAICMAFPTGFDRHDLKCVRTYFSSDSGSFFLEEFE